MPETRDDGLASFCRSQRDKYVGELAAFCSFPSVSAEVQHAADLVTCAEWLREQAIASGFQVARLIPTAGSPVLYAEYWVDPEFPTILVYGHYDVQPSGDPSQWTSPPFAPAVRDDAFFARGATDDKAHVLMHLKAVEARLKCAGALPVNVKLVVEGEEEIGSPHFDSFVSENRQLLSADVAIVSDTPGFMNGHPALCVGVRGLVVAEIEITGTATDVHSGLYGGGIRNPAGALAQMLASLKDPDTGRVAIEGFYNNVVSPDASERRDLTRLPFDETDWLASIGAHATHGEMGWTTLERIWWRPTLDVNSVMSGDDSGSLRTIVPAKARARISCRLVANQSPQAVADLLLAALSTRAPDGLEVRVTSRPVARPVSLAATHPLVAAASRSILEVFGEAPLLVRMGGSIPPVAALADTGMPCLLVGVSKLTDNFHGPDEHIDVDRLVSGTLLMAGLAAEIAQFRRHESGNLANAAPNAS